ncbi:MAG: phage portal protein, partial [bacterium]
MTQSTETATATDRPRDAKGRFVSRRAARQAGTGGDHDIEARLSDRAPGRAIVPVRRRRRVEGRYDAAVTTHDNRRHWAHADALSADAAASSDVRRILRNRARYEVANNSYARGIVVTLANDTVGTGPRLQLLTDDAGVNREIEREFDLWATEVCLAEKLRTMRMARAQDGESFAVMANNPVLGHPVKLDLRVIEADQVTSPFGTGHRLQTTDYREARCSTGASSAGYSLQPAACEIDGILLDRHGNPAAYRVLKDHPGGSTAHFIGQFITVPAANMVHVFRQERPGQHRGVPEITPALPLFAQLRRFTLAVLGAAESAAEFAGIVYTDAPPNGEADAVEPMDLIELER